MAPQISDTVSDAFKAAVDFVLPLICVHCGDEGSLLCVACISNAPNVPRDACVKCAEPTREFLRMCGSCVALPPPLDRLITRFRYGGPVRDAVHALKYRGITAIAPAMAEEMSRNTFFTRTKIDCVVPVPMHRDRLNERGYNQAAILAQKLAESQDFPYIEDALTKVRSTVSQVELTKHERALSLRNAFEAKYDFGGAHVLLIDDVCTTGNTLMNCAATLKRAGARRVSAVVFAKEMLAESPEIPAI